MKPEDLLLEIARERLIGRTLIYSKRFQVATVWSIFDPFIERITDGEGKLKILESKIISVEANISEDEGEYPIYYGLIIMLNNGDEVPVNFFEKIKLK